MVVKKNSLNQIKPQLKEQTNEIRSIKSYLLVIIVAFVVLAVIVGSIIYFVSQEEEPLPAQAPQIIIQPQRNVEVAVTPDVPETEEPTIPKVEVPKVEEPVVEPVSEVIWLEEYSLELKQGETKTGILFLKNLASVSTEMIYDISFTSVPAELSTQIRELNTWFVEIPFPKKLQSKEVWEAPFKLVIPEDAVLGDYEATFEVICDSQQCGDEETAILKMKISVI